MMNSLLELKLIDEEWESTYIDHDRLIARAIIYDDDGYFYFAKISRDDEFGNVTLIETIGGGIEDGESYLEACKREAEEEIGAIFDHIEKIGIVSDYYNLIHRHNINHYYLCHLISFTESKRTHYELKNLHMKTLKLTYSQALVQYDKNKATKLGRLVTKRELPILMRAHELLASREDEIQSVFKDDSN